ncbi:asparagine synthase-related protein [Salegentibacter chungangensis]|uniref:asparagine synthase (glutamine-hydrolyzing) n=1 Tax=Salegentibacter chungangensis TaxID=1335724 RepID=A0ABW3NTJ0_9FLAO
MPKLNIKISKKDSSFKAELQGTNRFQEDAFSFENEKYFLVTNGVNYNFNSPKAEENARYCLSEYERKGDDFFKDFRGSFSGAIYDKSEDKWLIYTNQFGEQSLFYTQTENEFFISSDIFELTRQLQISKTSYGLDKEAAYYLLTYGYMLRDLTLVDKIKKIEAGHYLKINKGELLKKQYFSIDNTPEPKLGSKDAIEGIDLHFRKAVEKEYEKDLRYSREHFATLSGGLDSRMTVWVANEMGYKNSTNLTFSQSDYLDMELSRKISKHLHQKWHFAELDEGEHLIDGIDQMVKDTNALYHYSGASALSRIKSFSTENYGLVHTGLLGDAVLGTHNPDNAYAEATQVKATSRRLMHRNQKDHLRQYRNNETAELYVRGFNGILSNSAMLQNFSEAASPFLDVDFFNFCMSIPAEYRAHHKIYKKWILEKYPQAAKFKWESINAKITDKSVLIRGKEIPLKHFGKFVVEGFFHNIGRPVNNTYSKAHMNPFNYWYRTNEKLQKYLWGYFEEHMPLVKDEELKSDCMELFKKGNAIEKMQVLTLLSAIKQLGI